MQTNKSQQQLNIEAEEIKQNSQRVSENQSPELVKREDRPERSDS